MSPLLSTPPGRSDAALPIWISSCACFFICPRVESGSKLMRQLRRRFVKSLYQDYIGEWERNIKIKHKMGFPPPARLVFRG